MFTKQKVIIIVGVLVILLILLMVLVSRVSRNQTSENGTTITPTVTIDPTQIIQQITFYPTPENTPLGRLKKLHAIPQKYQDITIEYKPRSDTFVIYYQGSQATAEQSFQNYIRLNNVSGVRSEYISLDGVSVTLPPPGFE